MTRHLTSLVISLSFALALGACVQLPTEKSAVVDARPQISFQVPLAAESAGWHVFVDNLPVGSVSQFVHGKSALRILPGTHVIRVERPGLAPVEERIYVGDGVSKTIIIN